MAIVRPHRIARRLSKRHCPILVLLALAVFIVAGCAAAESPAAPADDLELVEGRDIYIKNCANCHGGAGGGGVGSKLDDGRVVERYPEPADEIELVANGVRAMPEFDAKLTETEIEAVVRYTREILAATG